MFFSCKYAAQTTAKQGDGREKEDFCWPKGTRRGMSPGLPNSWLNCRAWSQAVVRLVYWRHKKHLLLCLPDCFFFFFHCSPNANALEGAPWSTIEACPLTWEEKQRAFKCYFPRKAQESDQTSAQMFLKCYPSFPQLLLAASTPLGLESRARAGCWPMAWQAVVSLLRRRRPHAAASWAGAQGGSATCINLSISHTPHQLSPSGTTRSYRILQVGKDH